MYTWGYIKESTLAKLNIQEEEANQYDFLSRFPYYANEAMTQICSAVKPHEKFLQIEVVDKNTKWKELTAKYGVYINEANPIVDTPLSTDEQYEEKVAFWKEWNSLYFADEYITFPDDFVAFSDDVAMMKESPIIIGGQIVNSPVYEETDDETLEYVGYNQICCRKIGQYRVPYRARWFFFTKELANDVTITAPADICDALPSYIASQCLKIDDEARAAIYRNEYEMFLARMDDTSFRAQRTLHIGGGW